MSLLKLSEIIRTEKDSFKTPNITACFEDGNIEVICEYFRTNLHERELFLFFQFQDQLHFPIWFEFRSINNNVLFLIEEFEIGSFDLLQRVLNSSMEKEEQRTTQMKAIVFHTLKAPPFSYHLKNFKIEDSFRMDVFER